VNKAFEFGIMKATEN